MKRPNILFLMSDEHRYDFAGFAGHPVVRTPNLDLIAKCGTVFANCYTPSPICVPGRQAMMAGCIPSHCGCFSYGDDLPRDHMTFAKRFSQYAYNTCACGKLHHYGRDQMQGWNLRIGYDNDISPKNIEGFKSEELERYAVSSKWWSWDKEVRESGVAKSPYLCRDELAVAGAIQYIDDYFISEFYQKKRDNQPLLLKVSLTLPHYPFVTDEKRFDYYYDKVEPFSDERVFEHPGITRPVDNVRIGETVSLDDVRRATAAYCGMIEKMDDLMGEVLEALRNAGQDLDDWLIIYASDHGELLGQHGLWMKYKFFEASVKVPLVISFPKRFTTPGVVDANVSLCDLFATMCEVADIDLPSGLDSRSLVPLMKGDASHWKNEVVSQIDDDLMIKRGALKFSRYSMGEDVLFDLKRDPTESENFANLPGYADDMRRFRRRADELAEEIKSD